MQNIPVGYTVAVNLSFQSAGALVDVTSPFFEVFDPAGTSLGATALGASISTGVYTAEYDTTGLATGVHRVAGYGTYSDNILRAEGQRLFQVVSSFSHIVPLADTEDVLAWLAEYTAGDEPLIADLTLAASERVRNFTGRRFGERNTVTDERHVLGHTHDADRHVVLVRAPLESFTALYMDAELFTDAREVTSVVACDYKVDWGAGVVTWKDRLCGTAYASYISSETIPPAIEHAVKRIVTHWYRSRHSEGLTHESLSSLGWSRLPDPEGSILNSIQSYVHPRVGSITV